MLLVDEKYEAALTKKLSAFETTVTRLSAEEVEAEIEHAKEVARELEAEEVNQDLTDMYNRTGNSFKL